MAKYNGWANWETWNVNLWIDNEEPMYRAKVDFIKRTPSKEITGYAVQRFVLEFMPKGTPDMDSQDRGYAAVRWGELASSWRAERREYR